jgi:predicted protein tyrosine phosphatase
MPTFHVYSRSEIQRLSPPFGTPHIFISISTPEDDAAKIETNEYTLGILRLWFYDADNPFYDFLGDRAIGDDVLFSAAQAREILDFVRANPTAEQIIVHCDAGRCRSTATAAALSKILTGDDKIFFDSPLARMRQWSPNMRVYRTILNEHFK